MPAFYWVWNALEIVYWVGIIAQLMPFSAEIPLHVEHAMKIWVLGTCAETLFKHLFYIPWTWRLVLQIVVNLRVYFYFSGTLGFEVWLYANMIIMAFLHPKTGRRMILCVLFGVASESDLLQDNWKTSGFEIVKHYFPGIVGDTFLWILETQNFLISFALLFMQSTSPMLVDGCAEDVQRTGIPAQIEHAAGKRTQKLSCWVSCFKTAETLGLNMEWAADMMCPLNAGGTKCTVQSHEVEGIAIPCALIFALQMLVALVMNEAIFSERQSWLDLFANMIAHNFLSKLQYIGVFCLLWNACRGIFTSDNAKIFIKPLALLLALVLLNMGGLYVRCYAFATMGDQKEGWYFAGVYIQKNQWALCLLHIRDVVFCIILFCMGLTRGKRAVAVWVAFLVGTDLDNIKYFVMVHCIREIYVQWNLILCPWFLLVKEIECKGVGINDMGLRWGHDYHLLTGLSDHAMVFGALVIRHGVRCCVFAYNASLEIMQLTGRIEDMQEQVSTQHAQELKDIVDETQKDLKLLELMHYALVDKGDTEGADVIAWLRNNSQPSMLRLNTPLAWMRVHKLEVAEGAIVRPSVTVRRPPGMDPALVQLRNLGGCPVENPQVYGMHLGHPCVFGGVQYTAIEREAPQSPRRRRRVTG